MGANKLLWYLPIWFVFSVSFELELSAPLVSVVEPLELQPTSVETAAATAMIVLTEANSSDSSSALVEG